MEPPMAVDYFLEIITDNGPIQGETTDADFPNQLQPTSWSIGAQNSGNLGGANKPHLQEMNLTLQVSAATPSLMKAVVSGTHLKQVTITCRKADGSKKVVFLQIRLHDAYVTSHNASSGTDGESVPTESISINFVKVEYAYSRQKPDGSVEPARLASWDQNKNAPGPSTLGKK